MGDPRRVVVPWLLGLGPFAIGLYLWSGVLGVMWKAGEFGSVFSMVAAASILASPFRAITRKLLYLSIVVAVVLATYIYVTYESTGPNDLSISEHEAGTWLAKRATPEEVVFTDLRLAAPLIVANHLGVVGINDYEAPETVRQELMAIYYGEDGPGRHRGDAQSAHTARDDPALRDVLGSTKRRSTGDQRVRLHLQGERRWTSPTSTWVPRKPSSSTTQGGVRIFRLNGP